MKGTTDDSDGEDLEEARQVERGNVTQMKKKGQSQRK